MRKTYTVENTSSEPFWLQIEWWADVLYLLPREKVTFVIYIDKPAKDDFEFENDKDNINSLYINNSTDYFIQEDVNEIHHHKYGSNVIGWSGKLCKESSLKGSIIHPSLIKSGS